MIAFIVAAVIFLVLFFVTGMVFCFVIFFLASVDCLGARGGDRKEEHPPLYDLREVIRDFVLENKGDWIN